MRRVLVCGGLTFLGCADVDRRSGEAGGIVSTTRGGDSGSDDADPPVEDDDGSTGTGVPRLDLGTEPGDPGVCAQDVDIVLVMDVTASMGEFIEALVADLEMVDATVKALDLPSPPRYGLVVFADDWALLNGGEAFADLDVLSAEFATWIAFTEGDEQIGGGEPNYDFPENSLDALHGATRFAWRPADTTTRVVIHTTDDTFWDGPGTFEGHAVEHGYAETIAALQAERIRVFSFAAREGGDCECENVAPGWFGPYEGQASIPDSTDGGVYELADVLQGSLSLGAAIPEAVADSVCAPYEPVG
jgi:hypothetical protein